MLLKPLPSPSSFQPPLQVGDWIYNKPPSPIPPLQPSWKGPLQIILIAPTTAVKIKGYKSWIYISLIKRAPLTPPIFFPSYTCSRSGPTSICISWLPTISKMNEPDHLKLPSVPPDYKWTSRLLCNTTRPWRIHHRALDCRLHPYTDILFHLLLPFIIIMTGLLLLFHALLFSILYISGQSLSPYLLNTPNLTLNFLQTHSASLTPPCWVCLHLKQIVQQHSPPGSALLLALFQKNSCKQSKQIRAGLTEWQIAYHWPLKGSFYSSEVLSNN